EAAKKTPKGVLPADRITGVLKSRNVSVNLFGRMLAELPSTEVDGAVQFAHAFTVHGTAVEVDFFTAVDDVPKDNDRGSGHMNAGQFSAGTFYRYANVNLDQLVDNTGDAEAARTAITEFLRAFVSTVPSGKQNATAAMTLPDLVHVAVRSDRPVSFAPAFETALYGSDGYTARACQELDRYAGRLRAVWPDDAVRGYATVEDKRDFAALGGRHAAYPELVVAMVAGASAGERWGTGSGGGWPGPCRAGASTGCSCNATPCPTRAVPGWSACSPEPRWCAAAAPWTATRSWSSASAST